jgi:NAD(P)-dependent dehydrogenase (short-subunit alcohol dehydrogenase family)
MNNTLMGRVAWVTGGGSGIGLAGALELVKAGAHVVISGRNASTNASALEQLQALGSAEAILLDVADKNAVQTASKHILTSHGRIDILINSAGMNATKRNLDVLTTESWDEVVNINLNGTMRVCEAALDKLSASGGCIINIASMLSFFGGGLVPGYSASKGGVAQLTKSLAIAYAPQGVRVNAIAPGWISTPLTRALQDDPARAGPILARTPMGRWGTPEDLQGLALFLAGPHAAFMTGSIITVDGGYSVS